MPIFVSGLVDLGHLAVPAMPIFVFNDFICDLGHFGHVCVYLDIGLVAEYV
jgi:uncharacterized protein YycO